jgi:CRP/FNR family transcriptional regulator, cyclic AMP receptor protein
MADERTEPSFLERLNASDRDAMTALGRRRALKRATTLFTEGDTSDRVVIVVSGRVKISYFTEDGREVVLAVRGPGELLGEFSAIDGEPRSATATALDDAEVLVVTSDDFRTFVRERSEAAFALLELVVARLRDADRKRIEFAAYDTVGRVARRLVEMAQRFGEPDEKGTRIDLPLSQDELAGWTGASREAVSKALQHLRKRGWIETGRRNIVVLDIEGLSNRAD